LRVGEFAYYSSLYWDTANAQSCRITYSPTPTVGNKGQIYFAGRSLGLSYDVSTKSKNDPASFGKQANPYQWNAYSTANPEEVSVLQYVPYPETTRNTVRSTVTLTCTGSSGKTASASVVIE